MVKFIAVLQDVLTIMLCILNIKKALESGAVA
ncbi:hypothetical protein Desgi_4696 [Desulfoscipio gibsoniae DSM 7213]|uniref:Uncharacterized protein n=1 Tax=Desulfoscipio gibsoniae DSM 7213 TaxID=767817 RepID=R4KTI9_9FIRM|nr:hypothetical protein Desgi_4696 [Desulfoscipio gibsoniae DSM 7213]